MPRRAAFICDSSLWAGGHPPGHPMRPERLQYTWEMLQAYNAFAPAQVQVLPPRFPSDDELARFHTRQYIEVVRRLSRGEGGIDLAKYNFGPGDNPVFPGMFESEALKVGSSLVAAELLLAGQVEVAFSFAGGLHHAGREQASGFCVFGDVAIAIQRLVDAGWRVAYIDIDAHHGDGVQAAFYDDPRVLTISFHESGRYLFPYTGFAEELGQGKGFGYSINVPLPPQTDDGIFLWAFDEIVPFLVEDFAPDVVVAEFGVDAHWQDPLTHLALTTYGLEALFRRIDRLAPRLLALGGGGYEVSVVPRAWTLAWGVLSGQTFANDLPPAVASRYDPPRLHDDVVPLFLAERRREARTALEGIIVRDLKSPLGLP